MVLPRVSRVIVEIRPAQEEEDGVPDDVVVIRLPKHSAGKMPGLVVLCSRRRAYTLQPQVAATEAVGTALDSAGIQVLGFVMAGCLVISWTVIFIIMLRCLKNRQLLWPKDEM